MSSTRKMFATLPSSRVSELGRQSFGRLFGFGIQEARQKASLSIEDAADLSGMEITEWMAIEDGYVPQDINQLRAMAEALEVSFDKMAFWALVCQHAWES